MFFLLAATLVSLGEPEPWTACLYNNESIGCRRTFQCTEAPCGTFKLEWKDGLSDIFTMYKRGRSRNISYYSDTRGGKWIMQSYAGRFGLENLANGNTIIFDMTLRDCRESGLSDLCK